MSLDEREETPSVIAVRMTEEDRKDVKVLCAHRDMNLKEWYREAFGAHVERRERFEEEGRDEEFIYRAKPREGERVSVEVYEDTTEALRKWAEKDNVNYVAAYYTAIKEHIRRQKEQIL
jgi:hypothetical protein